MSLPSSETAAAPGAAPATAGTPGLGARFGRFLRVRIGAEQLALELLAGRRAPRVLARLEQGYVSADDQSPALPTDLAGALGALGPALDALEARLAAQGASLRGLVCDIVIDDSWMLYDIVRADLRGLTPRAADSLIGASLADVAGVDSSELVSRWHAQGKSPYTLACGLPASALPALDHALRRHGVVAGSVEGEFVYEYNRHRERLDPTCSIVAVVRDAGAQLGVLIDGVLTSMSFEFGVGTPKELELRGRGLLRVAGKGGETAVHFYAITRPGIAAPEPWVALPAAA